MQSMIILSATIQWSKVGMVLGIIAGLAILFGILIIVVTKVLLESFYKQFIHHLVKNRRMLFCL